MKLILGLGNPGKRYADTRHNVGWRVAELLVRRAGATAWKEKFEAAVAEIRPHGRRVVLARPLTFMNESGRAVRPLMDFWKLQADDLLVVLDDMALETGRVRLRAEGSDGGHNGLASIIAHLGHEAFARLRVGIGPAPAVEAHADFVLSPFTAQEQPAIEEAIAQAADAAECWIAEGTEAAMNRFNRTSHP
ncbi:MAG TPA: aminoacyl-tRNA hydrolase [Phycisphaerae bacterium]|nr:aminoacyl-tRNA hydrolase [Phycisphaerae bacterium]